MNVFVYTSVAQCHSELCLEHLSRGAKGPEASVDKKYEERSETKTLAHREK